MYVYTYVYIYVYNFKLSCEKFSCENTLKVFVTCNMKHDIVAIFDATA